MTLQQTEERLSAPPFERGGLWGLQHGDWSVEVDPLRGARICAFSLKGRNALTGPDVDPENYGSTFWTSPQSQWGWPPVVEVDRGPYTVVDSDSGFLCAGTLSPSLGILVTKRFSVLRSRNALCVEYAMSNQTSETLRMAPWEISRVPGGLTFFETGEARYKHPPVVELEVVEASGITWFDYQRAAIEVDKKVFAHSRGGWLAHVAGGMALIKQFEPVPADRQAPGEAVIELFASGTKDYVEIEQQGAFSKIGPWKSLSWRVVWLLRELPAGLQVRSGNLELARWVKSQFD